MISALNLKLAQCSNMRIYMHKSDTLATKRHVIDIVAIFKMFVSYLGFEIFRLEIYDQIRALFFQIPLRYSMCMSNYCLNIVFGRL